jgi:hypothetical protein
MTGCKPKRRFFVLARKPSMKTDWNSNQRHVAA